MYKNLYLADRGLFRSSLLAPRLGDEIMFPEKYLVMRKSAKTTPVDKNVQVNSACVW